MSHAITRVSAGILLLAAVLLLESTLSAQDTPTGQDAQAAQDTPPAQDTPTVQDTLSVQEWKRFRAAYPYHIQAIALSAAEADGGRTVDVSQSGMPFDAVQLGNREGAQALADKLASIGYRSFGVIAA